MSLTPRYQALIRTLPPHSAKRWLYPFQVAARCPDIKGNALHDLLKRAVERELADRRKDDSGRWMYAKARRGRDGPG